MDYVYVIRGDYRNCDSDVEVFRNADDAVLKALRIAIEQSIFEDDFEIVTDEENRLVIRHHFEGYYITVTKEEVK